MEESLLHPLAYFTNSQAELTEMRGVRSVSQKARAGNWFFAIRNNKNSPWGLVLGAYGQRQSGLVEVLSLSHHQQYALPAALNPGFPKNQLLWPSGSSWL